MHVKEIIASLSLAEKQLAFEILRLELDAAVEEFVSPDWHEEVLATRLADPDSAPPTPFRDAIAEIRAELRVSRDTH